MNSDDSLDNLILDEVPEKEKTKTGNTGNDQNYDDMHRTQSGSLTKATLTKSLEEKEKMLQEFH